MAMDFSIDSLMDASDGVATEVVEGFNVLEINTSKFLLALKPLLKRKSGPADAYILNAVMLDFDVRSLILRATDLLTFVETAVDMEIDRPDWFIKPIALDLVSLAAVVKNQGETTKIAVSGDMREIRIFFAGGSAHIPSYALDPVKFMDPTKRQTVMSKKSVSAVVLLDTVSSLKGMAAYADLPEMKMLFGEGDYLYASDGLTVTQSECYFPQTAVSLSDVAVIEGIAGLVEPFETVDVVEFDKYVSVACMSGSVSIPKRS